ncbi:MAG: hypothetical protein ACREOE_08065, partial [Gemmatimonadales bacterium]
MIRTCEFAEVGRRHLGVLTEPASVLAKSWSRSTGSRLLAPGRPGSRWWPGPARSACWRRCSASSAAIRC